jgi:hypothetical protein
MMQFADDNPVWTVHKTGKKKPAPVEERVPLPKFLKDWNEEDHPRDEDGKFGEGGGSGDSSPTAGARGGAMGARAVGAIQGSGGKVSVVDPATPKGAKAAAKAEEQTGEAYAAFMAGVAERDGTEDEGMLSEEDERLETGLSLMGHSLITDEGDSEDGSSFVFMTHTESGEVSGAARTFTNDDGFLVVSTLGTNGLQAGAGTALMAQIFKTAAGLGYDGAGVELDRPLSDALPFYKRIGFDVSGGGGVNTMMDAEEVQAWVADYESAGGK